MSFLYVMTDKDRAFRENSPLFTRKVFNKQKKVYRKLFKGYIVIKKQFSFSCFLFGV